MHGRICFITLALLAGCADAPTSTTPPSQDNVAAPAAAFDAATTGTIRGTVRWDGEVPIAEERIVRAHATNPYLYKNPAKVVLPHYPKVDAKIRGVENAVVFLRKVEPRLAKLWDHAPIRVEMRDRQMHIVQGERRAAVGFAPTGATIEMVNRDADYYNVVARGAAFFAQPLIEKDRIGKRTLTQPGIVNLHSGNAYYWQHAHLFVVEHPYYTTTDIAGRFTLDQVPAGTYELVCWLPSWHVKRREHDPETGTLARLVWDAPKEQACPITVRAGEQAEAEYRWNLDAFK